MKCRTSLRFYFLCLFAWDVIVTFWLFVLEKFQQSQLVGKKALLVGSSNILGLLLSMVCWLTRFVWKCCVK
jgi:hypothetical protein